MKLNRWPHSPPQPISMGSHIDTTGHVVQEGFSPIQNVFQQPLERPIESEERIMTDMGTNTSDVVIEPTVGILSPPHMEANTQTSVQTVEVLIHPVMGDNTMLLHVSLSIYWVVNMTH